MILGENVRNITLSKYDGLEDKFVEKYGSLYDYSESVYMSKAIPIKITCTKHNESFYQSPEQHLKFTGCKHCQKENRVKTNSDKFFITLTALNLPYDISKVVYVNNKTRVELICPIHGSFTMTPAKILGGNKCTKCGHDSQKTSIEDFIRRAKEISPQYDYSKVVYINSNTKVEVICRTHGSFFIKPSDILGGKGCRKCFEDRKKTLYNKPQEQFIEEMKETSPQYDYSKVNYINSKTKVEVICKEHGSFHTVPSSLLQGMGCPECGKLKIGKAQSLELSEFMERVKTLHGDKFKIYEDTYINKKSNVDIECEIHGRLSVNATQFLRSHYGCPKCGNDQAPKTKTTKFEEFKRRVEERFGDKFILIEDSYINLRKPVQAICKEHGQVTVNPRALTNGTYGCPKCAFKNSLKNYFDMPTKVYYIQLTDEYGKKYYKIGITVKSLKQRFYNLKKFNMKIRIIDYKEFPTGRPAFMLEQFILDKFKDKKTKDDVLYGSGQTEVFDYDIYPEIKKYFDHHRKQEQE